MNLMTKGSDEFHCLNDALMSVEKVADYINEMQRISETFTPVFQELSECYEDIEVKVYTFYLSFKFSKL